MLKITSFGNEMQFLELKQKLNNFIVFNLNDIRKIDSNFDRRRLNEWINKKYIKKLRRSYYIFSNLEINEFILFSIANKIYSPSYISLETALSHYNLIPEGVYTTTSVCTRKTKNIKNTLGNFSYKGIKPSLMFGYEIIKKNNYNFKIAEIEKSILDYFYLNTQIKDEKDLEGLRLNTFEFKQKVEDKKLMQYLEKFNNKTLTKRIKKLLEFISND